jgi:hypothetical protein
MRMRTFAVAAAVALLGVTVSAQDVKTDFDKAANFGAIKTFALKLGTSWGNQIGEKRVMAEVEEVIVSKGWAKADEAKADAIVVVHGASQVKKDLNTFYSGMGGYRYRGFGGTGTATTTTSEYTVGTLVVDIFDAKTKQLMFRGTATDEISDKAEKNVKKVEKATTKMFKDFPPGSAKK